jgi:polyisoprenoid-binding protein YceI
MVATLLTALLLTSPRPGQSYVLDPARSVIKFHLDHVLHQVDGEARGIEAKALVGADGMVRAMVRFPVSSMQTGDANRDANMRAVLESDRFPYVVVKAMSPFNPPATVPAPPGPLKVNGEIDLHGVRQPIEVQLLVAFDASGAARLTGGLTVSLDAHRIDRPALLFKKVDDECKVQLDLVLLPEKK